MPGQITEILSRGTAGFYLYNILDSISGFPDKEWVSKEATEAYLLIPALMSEPQQDLDLKETL